MCTCIRLRNAQSQACGCLWFSSSLFFILIKFYRLQQLFCSHQGVDVFCLYYWENSIEIENAWIPRSFIQWTDRFTGQVTKIGNLLSTLQMLRMQSGESVSALLDIPDFHLTWPFKESVDLTFKTLCKCDIYIKIYNIYIVCAMTISQHCLEHLELQRLFY